MNQNKIGTRLGMLRNKIQNHREQEGLTQIELSRKSGFTDSYVGKIERGEKVPSLFAMLCIAEALSVEPQKLLEPDEKLIEVS